jgi:hypothetical protein
MELALSREEQMAARIAGAAYLFAIPLSIFSEFYVFGRLLDPQSLAVTAQRIASQQLLFRLGTASNFIVFVTDGVLISALYLVLRRIDRNLALLALVWRVIETALLFVALLYDMQAIKLLGGTAYLSGADPNELALLARLAISGHSAAYGFALVLAGLGSTVFAILWWRSGYVPRWLAGLGVLASVLLAIGTFIVIPFPAAQAVFNSAVVGTPIGLFELAMGGWLLFKGLPVHAPA